MDLRSVFRMVPAGACALVFGVGCSGEGAGAAIAASDYSVRDSAGVEIVELGAGALDNLPTLRLTEQPLLSIGEVDGDDPYLFGGVRLGLRTKAGEIVIYDGQAHLLRVYGPDGRFLHDLGRQGEGPGEYGAVSFLDRLADGRVAATDIGLGRVTFFDPATGADSVAGLPCSPGGALAPPGHDRTTGQPCYAAGTMGNGALVSTGAVMGASDPDPGVGRVRRIGSGRRILAISEGGVLSEVDSVVTAGWWNVNVGGNSSTGGDELYAPEGQHAIGLPGVALGGASEWKIAFYSSSSAPNRIIRVQRDAPLVTSDHLARVRASIDTIHPVLRPALNEYLSEFEIGGVIPTYGEIRFDAAGRLWVSDYHPPRVYRPAPRRDWTIFGTDGLPVARIATGPSTEVLDMGEDWLLRLEKDEMGVERVVLYGLTVGDASAGG